MGPILAERASEPSSTDALMLPQSYEEEAACQGSNVVDLAAEDLTAAAKAFLTTFTKPDLNSFGQNFRYVRNVCSCRFQE